MQLECWRCWFKRGRLKLEGRYLTSCVILWTHTRTDTPTIFNEIFIFLLSKEIPLLNLAKLHATSFKPIISLLSHVFAHVSAPSLRWISLSVYYDVYYLCIRPRVGCLPCAKNYKDWKQLHTKSSLFIWFDRLVSPLNSTYKRLM